MFLNFINTSLRAFRYGEGLLYIETQNLFNTSLLLCCSTSLSFHFDFLKRQIFYTISLYFFFLVPSLTYCALVSTFIILLKLFCLSDFKVHSSTKFTDPWNHAEVEPFKTGLLSYRNTVLQLFPFWPLRGCAIYAFELLPNIVFYQECQVLFILSGPTTWNCPHSLSWSSVRPTECRHLIIYFLILFLCIYSFCFQSKHTSPLNTGPILLFYLFYLNII